MVISFKEWHQQKGLGIVDVEEGLLKKQGLSEEEITKYFSNLKGDYEIWCSTVGQEPKFTD